MYQFIFLSFALLSLALILLLVNLTISKKSSQDREKTSPFECGFDPITKNRLPFSNHFFIISMIFLIFDVEITLLIPLIYLTKYLSIYSIFTAFMFLMILLLGLYIEYSEQSIDWKI